MGAGWGRKRPPAAQDAQFERVLREALRAAADSVVPSGDGLARIRRRLGEPWLVRQVPRIRARYADWLPVALAMAGVLIIAIAGIVAAGAGHHGPPAASLSATGASVGGPAGTGPGSGGGGRSPVSGSAEASAALLNPVPPGPTQAQPPHSPDGVSSARVKPSRPPASGAAPGRETGPSSTAAASCPPSSAGAPSATPAPTSPGPAPSPAVVTPAPGTPAPGAPAVGSQGHACDDGPGRQ